MKNRFKKIGFCLIAAALLIPSSAYATDGPQLGPGEWDAKGSEPLYIYPGCNVNTKTNFKSEGGDFQIRVRNVNPGNSYTISLWEYDPSDPDDIVTEYSGKTKVRGSGDQDFTYNVRNFIDGGDGAELYVKIESAYEDDNIVVYAYD